MTLTRALVFLGLLSISIGLASAQITQLAELTASDCGAPCDVGFAVAISQNTIAAGAPVPGWTYVFVEPATGWTNMTQTAKLTSTDMLAPSGDSVAISAGTIASGAPVVGTNEVASEVDVYVEGTNGWQNMSETARLTPSWRFTEDFGSSVAFMPSGKSVLVGQPIVGAVALFDEPLSGWQNETQSSALFNSEPGAAFGTAIASNGKIIVVSTPYGNGGAGAVLIYTPDGGGVPIQLTASDGAPGDHLGQSLAVSGNVIVAGAPGHAAIGAAYVFVRPDSGWVNSTQTAELTLSAANSGAKLGTAVSIEGDTIAVGAPDANVGERTNQGLIAGYRMPASGWTNMTASFVMTAADGAQGDQLGYSLAAGSGVVVSGAIGKNSNEGAVYVFGNAP